jgi:hypothetical protein
MECQGFLMLTISHVSFSAWQSNRMRVSPLTHRLYSRLLTANWHRNTSPFRAENGKGDTTADCSSSCLMTTMGTTSSSTLTTTGTTSPTTKFSWSARRAFGLVVPRSHATVAPIDTAAAARMVKGEPPAPALHFPPDNYLSYSKQSSSCSSERTTPSPPMALPPQLSQQWRQQQQHHQPDHRNDMMVADRSSTLTDPVAETLLAQEAQSSYHHHHFNNTDNNNNTTLFLADEMSQLQLTAAPSFVHAKPPPVPRPTAIRPKMIQQR